MKPVTLLLLVVVLVPLLLPGAVLGQDYQERRQGFCFDKENSLIRVPCPLDPRTGGPATKSFLGTLVFQIIQIALAVVGSIAVVFLLVGGYRYVIAHGNEELAESAKQTIYHAIIGFVIVILSFAIVRLIANLLIRGQP